jgi:inosose dehydratase
MRLATAPVSWGVDFADAAGNPPWRDVLDGIAASGLRGLELGPVGYLPEARDELAGELAARGLEAVGSFVFEPLHDPAQAAAVLATARRACAWIAAAGGRVLVILDRVSPARAATAGHADRAPRLAPAAWAGFRDRIAAVAAIADAAGLDPVLHPHAGTYLEFADEIEPMLAATGLGLCLDTGHLAYAGLDPVAWAARPEVRHVHLKDFDPALVPAAGGFWEAVAAGAFRPIGAGRVDFGGVLAALHGAGYAGWATLEQDRRPGSGDPIADVRRSVAHVSTIMRACPHVPSSNCRPASRTASTSS